MNRERATDGERAGAEGGAEDIDCATQTAEIEAVSHRRGAGTCLAEAHEGEGAADISKQRVGQLQRIAGAAARPADGEFLATAEGRDLQGACTAQAAAQGERVGEQAECVVAGVDRSRGGDAASGECQVGAERLVAGKAQCTGGAAADGELLRMLQTLESGLRQVERIGGRAITRDVDGAPCRCGLYADPTICRRHGAIDRDRIGLDAQSGVLNGQRPAQGEAAGAGDDDAAVPLAGSDRDVAVGVPACAAGDLDRTAGELQTCAAKLLIAGD